MFGDLSAGGGVGLIVVGLVLVAVFLVVFVDQHRRRNHVLPKETSLMYHEEASVVRFIGIRITKQRRAPRGLV